MTPSQYFSELTLRLRQAGFTVLPQEGGLLPVEWDGRPLCLITSDGSIRCRQEDIEGPDRELAGQQAIDLAAITAEYVDLLAEASELKADGLGTAICFWPTSTAPCRPGIPSSMAWSSSPGSGPMAGPGCGRATTLEITMLRQSRTLPSAPA